MLYTVLCLEVTKAIQKWQYILHDMPLRMSPPLPLEYHKNKLHVPNDAFLLRWLGILRKQ